MKQAILAATVLAVTISSTQAGPFNTEMGQPLEIDGYTDTGMAYQMLRPRNGFDLIALYGTEQDGACIVRAVDNIPPHDVFANADHHMAQNTGKRYEEVRQLLRDRYGPPDTGGNLAIGASTQWLSSIRSGREFSNRWFPKTGDVAQVYLFVEADKGQNTDVKIEIYWWFENNEDCEATLNDNPF